MDTQEQNPGTDKYISVHYDITTVMAAKALLTEALQAAVGLPVDRNIPLIDFIGRFEEQKGSDILAAAISKFIHMNVQIVILKFEKKLEHHEVPICASTGGLVDTVKEGFHMGAFSIECDAVDPADNFKIEVTVARALAVYGIAFKEMIINCMSQELSWRGPIEKWETMLLSLGVAGSEPALKGTCQGEYCRFLKVLSVLCQLPSHASRLSLTSKLADQVKLHIYDGPNWLKVCTTLLGFCPGFLSFG